MKNCEVFQLIANRYASKPDEFVLSIGHSERPFPDSPVGIYNLPEIQGYMSITLGQVREWAKPAQTKSDPA